MAKKSEVETITKSDAIREMVEEGVTSPKDGVEAIKAKHGLDVSPGMFSAVKSKMPGASGSVKVA